MNKQETIGQIIRIKNIFLELGAPFKDGEWQFESLVPYFAELSTIIEMLVSSEIDDNTKRYAILRKILR